MDLPEEYQFEKRGKVAIFTINRPKAMNAFTGEMLAAMDSAFAQFQADDDLMVAILTNAGDKVFCAGMDLKEAIPMITSGDEMGYGDHTKRPFSDVFKPIICAINGACIAGGVEFMLGTDIRIAAEHTSFGLGEVKVGIIPAGGSHIRLPAQIPWAVAMEMLLMGRQITAQRAYEVGLINAVVPKDEVLDTAIAWAEEICKAGPLAVRTAKEIAVRGLALETGFVLEKALAAKVMRSEDAKEGPTAFIEKRAPVFKGK